MIILGEEVEKLLSIVDAYNSDRGIGDLDDVTNVSLIYY